MKLTTKGRYAVTAMLDLTIHGVQGPVCLGDIAARQDISLAYLEQLFTRLRKQALVVSTRGPGGGYRLGRAASRISIAAVIAAVDEPLDSTRCSGGQDCQRGERCLTHQLWEDLSQHIFGYLDGLTLADLAARRDVLAVAARQGLDQAHEVEVPVEIPLRTVVQD